MKSTNAEEYGCIGDITRKMCDSRSEPPVLDEKCILTTQNEGNYHVSDGDIPYDKMDYEKHHTISN